MKDLLLEGYPKDTQRFDEMFDESGEVRAHYRPLYNRLISPGGRPLKDLLSAAERQIRENGVTYNVYDDAQGTDRPWTLDPIPLVLSADEWTGIEKGVIQRATLLNSILGDLYGPQELLRKGLLPPALILGHPGFLRPMHGIRPPKDKFLYLLAVDLARSPDGSWWVLADRTQAPSGAGYALENRQVVSRLFPQLFRDQRVRRMVQFFTNLRDTLNHMAPKGDGVTHTVILTPGSYNETYFEHAYLARYLGFPLVEGRDLTVRDGRVWRKTLSGLRRVHAIIRRLDDDFCDPVELRPDSALGVPGLMDAVRAGTVLLANAPGVSVMESSALHGFMPKLCAHLLGEPLALPSAATWWCGEATAMEAALKRSSSLVFKSAHAQQRFNPIFGEDLDAAGLAQLAARVRAAPQDYVAQELIGLSRTPVMDRQKGQHLVPRTVGLRVFVVATPDGYFAMPGGLARTASDNDARILSTQRGGGSKDVWICGKSPQLQLTLIHRPIHASDLVRGDMTLSSRVAESLFWFGRYCERSDNLSRLLRVALGHIVEDADDSSEWEGIAKLCQDLDIFDRNEAAPSRAEAADELIRATVDLSHNFGLARCLQGLSQIGYQLRERLSDDNWRTLNRLPLTLENKSNNQIGAFDALASLDMVITHLMTLAGFALDGMTRDHGWRFLSLGRRIERTQFQTRAILSALAIGDEHGEGNGLNWLLEVSDSIMTYRSRYIAEPEWLATLDLLISDLSNPRSLVFQSEGLVTYLDRLSQTLGDMPGKNLSATHAELLNIDPETTLNPRSQMLKNLLLRLQHESGELSNALSEKFFSHIGDKRNLV